MENSKSSQKKERTRVYGILQAGVALTFSSESSSVEIPRSPQVGHRTANTTKYQCHHKFGTAPQILQNTKVTTSCAPHRKYYKILKSSQVGHRTANTTKYLGHYKLVTAPLILQILRSPQVWHRTANTTKHQGHHISHI